MIRVLLVDDQPLVRTGLRRILAPKAGFEVVGECADGSEVEQAVEERQPDLVIMDVRMKHVDGAEATRRLRRRRSSPPVLVLTTFDDDEVLSASLRAGASGFQLKDAPGEDLIRAARAVAEGGAWLDPAVTGRVLTTYRASPEGPAGPATGATRPAGTIARARATPAPAPGTPQGPGGALTEREREVLALVGRGLTNAEIATALHISEMTVKSHVSHIFVKLDLRDRAAAIVFAFDNGIAVANA